MCLCHKSIWLVSLAQHSFNCSQSTQVYCSLFPFLGITEDHRLVFTLFRRSSFHLSSGLEDFALSAKRWWFACSLWHVSVVNQIHSKHILKCLALKDDCSLKCSHSSATEAEKIKYAGKKWDRQVIHVLVFVPRSWFTRVRSW